IKVIGDRHSLRSDILCLLLEAEETTKDNTALTLVIAFNYGSRVEKGVDQRRGDVLRPQADSLDIPGEAHRGAGDLVT
ncbi:undecaprenyl diphosphate synthase family protein, partial [Rhizobium ruizarguesonis]